MSVTPSDRQPWSAPAWPPIPKAVSRVLFLDDDPRRASVFLAERPEAVWVQTVVDCLNRLEENWDEVHLDHDLGGEHFVDVDREDCGMEVVRWLCLHPRPHLQRTWFCIHSHNGAAASIMTMQMHLAGYRVEFRPFGASFEPPPPDPNWGGRPRRPRWLDRLRDYLSRRR